LDDHYNHFNNGYDDCKNKSELERSQQEDGIDWVRKLPDSQSKYNIKHNLVTFEPWVIQSMNIIGKIWVLRLLLRRLVGISWEITLLRRLIRGITLLRRVRVAWRVVLLGRRIVLRVVVGRIHGLRGF